MNIVDRAGWGAAAPKFRPSFVAPSRRKYFVVHHSGAPSSQSAREIQHWCMAGRGFADIDYNFLVDQSGKIYEGRGWDVIGAHTVGYNLTGAGVCIIGNDQASDAAKRSVRWLYDAYVRRCGHHLELRGHRQLATTGTTCPGAHVFAWVQGGLQVADLVPQADAGRVTSTAGPGQRVLRFGSKGADVAFLQRWLGLSDDGSFGPKTEAAVKRYQRDHKLVADGVVGPKTWAAMRVKR
jgi:hypothetical protein